MKPFQGTNMRPIPFQPKNLAHLWTPQNHTSTPKKNLNFAVSSCNKVSAHIRRNASLPTVPTSSKETTWWIQSIKPNNVKLSSMLVFVNLGSVVILFTNINKLKKCSHGKKLKLSTGTYSLKLQLVRRWASRDMY